MSTRKTVLLGEDVLRETARAVDDYSDTYIQRVIKDLIDTMRSKGLLGMAAPQIGESLRIFISELRETKFRKLTPDKLRVYINPVITHQSKEVQIGWEGCGSIPGLFGQVERAQEITIE